MAVKSRKYKNYDAYLKHQAKKLDVGVKKGVKKFLKPYFSKNVWSFKKRIGSFQKYVKKGKILCLGARTGAEVAAFIELGFPDAIGIDINPGKDNPYVIKGDFHNMSFEDNSFDIIYSNCIDHAWNLKKLSKEIDRVLKPDGRLILEVDHSLKKNKKERLELLKKGSKYESVLWDDIEDVYKEFEDFKVTKKFVSAYNIFLVVIFEKA